MFKTEAARTKALLRRQIEYYKGELRKAKIRCDILSTKLNARNAAISELFMKLKLLLGEEHEEIY